MRIQGGARSGTQIHAGKQLGQLVVVARVLRRSRVEQLRYRAPPGPARQDGKFVAAGGSLFGFERAQDSERREVCANPRGWAEPGWLCGVRSEAPRVCG